jgi:hypothetical protein
MPKGFGSVRVANSITSGTTNLASFQPVLELTEREGLHVDVENASEEIDNKKKGCFTKILVYQAKYPVTFVMVGALIGLCAGEYTYILIDMISSSCFVLFSFCFVESSNMKTSHASFLLLLNSSSRHWLFNVES